MKELIVKFARDRPMISYIP